MFFQNHRSTNIAVVRQKKVMPERSEKHFTLFKCPMLQLQVLVLEDRVQYNCMNLINNIIPKSAFANDPKIQELCRMLYCNKKNPVKRGIIGRYNYELSQNMTSEEQIAFADCVEAYDKAIMLPERVMKARIRDYAKQQINDNVDVLAEICMCEISANYTKMYHEDIAEKIPNTDLYLRNMKWSGSRMNMIEDVLDKIAAHVAGYIPIDFTQSDQFLKSYEKFATAISKDTRLKQQYDIISKQTI